MNYIKSIPLSFFIIFLSLGSCKSDALQEDLSVELQDMAIADQEIRDQALYNFSNGTSIIDESIEAIWDSIKTSHTERFKAILLEYGWPGYSLVGKKASNDAWVIAQHASLEIQELALPLLVKEVKSNNANPIALAYLTDRIRILQQQPQVYGTQINWLDESGYPKPYEIENPSEVDQRRLGIGLETLSSYLEEVSNQKFKH